MRNNLLPIAKEGWNYILCSLGAFLIFTILDLEFLQFFSFLALIFFLFVFRNPERLTPIFAKNSVVSPVDGVILSIEELQEHEYAYKIECDSSYLNISLLRTPLNSTIKSVNFQKGARLSKFSPLSKDINENYELVFEDENANMVKVTHMLKQSFKSIDIDAIISQKLTQGARYGLMVNGITTIYLPQNFRLNVSVSQKVNASESLIGYFS